MRVCVRARACVCVCVCVRARVCARVRVHVCVRARVRVVVVVVGIVGGGVILPLFFLLIKNNSRQALTHPVRVSLPYLFISRLIE